MIILDAKSSTTSTISAELIPSANLSTSDSSVTGNLAGAWWNGSRCCVLCNQAKSDMSETAFKNWLRKVAKHWLKKKY